MTFHPFRVIANTEEKFDKVYNKRSLVYLETHRIKLLLRILYG